MFCAKSLACLLVCVCVLCAVPALALDDEMHAHHHEATEQLGKVSFLMSCAPASQKAFERGVALLHSFGYEEAEEQFVEITKKDPACAMAHWGIAMSLFHQIWERPQESTRKRGGEEIEKAQKVGGKTERERGYISAVAVFYCDPAANDYLKRATAYSNAMGKLYQLHGHELHAMHFLLYAYLQTGQEDAAKQVVEQSKQIVATAPTNGDDTGMLEYFGFAGAHFPALYDLEMRHWADAAALQPAANASPHLQMITYWARTIAAAH